MSAGLALGPFVIGLDAMMLATAGGVAAFGGWLAGRRNGVRITSVLVDMFVAGAIVARIAFVAQWFGEYRPAPWTIFDIGDGGFSPWAGVAAALVVAAWKAHRRVPLRTPLATGLAWGAIAWALLMALPQPGGRGTPGLPGIELETIDGQHASVAGIGAGAPTVVNLWATWCPPCRREMPVLAEAQRTHEDVRFVFANQSEDAAAVRRFLQGPLADLRNVLLDPNGEVGREMAAPGLPTTLFFDARGRLVDTHVGPLSNASLAAKLTAARRSSSESTLKE